MVNFLIYKSLYEKQSDYNFSFDLSVADLYYSLCNGHTLIALSNDIQDNYDEVFHIMRLMNYWYEQSQKETYQ